MTEKECVQGRWIDQRDLEWLRTWIGEHPIWSRKRLARELCELWNWRDARGRIKDFAARSFLLKLEERGEVALPAVQTQKRRARPPIERPAGWEEPKLLSTDLEKLKPIRVQRIEPGGNAVAQRWAFYLERYHYLGFHVVGQNMGYLAQDSRGRDLGCLLFGAAAWRCAPRERFFRWNEEQRRERLQSVANNTRFLILPWVRVPSLASHLLGQAARRINGDWLERYGQTLAWLETFVERERFAGTCYRAANWQCVGQTRGRSRQDREHDLRVPVKDIYLYSLAA